ncbi:hypothetical protein AAVH_25641 [Aphelenchoides avenae]|nr:hypothetical protein AAVH_25641 [Aphelenchus avenae]
MQMNSSISAILLIGDGKFPWNLRPFRSYSERVSFGVSMVANTVLIMLLVRERNATIKPYSRVLLLNAVFDYVYTIVSIAVEMELELNQGTYIFVVNGFPKVLPSHWQRVFVGLWMYALTSTCVASIVEFIFRYLHVVKYVRLL